MLAQTFAPAMVGADSRLVSIECDMTNGLPGFVVVGLGDKAVDESRERVRSAIKNSGLTLPPKRITLNLAPADLPKDGSGYDLGMAVAILAASGQIDPLTIKQSLFLGELGLDGSIRPIRGAMMAAQLSTQQALERLFIPLDNALEASLLVGAEVFAVANLQQLYHHLVGDAPLTPLQPSKSIVATKSSAAAPVDFSHVYGQILAKRAAEIAAAGGHNLLISGPPGSGKTLIAKAILGILPEPSLEEMIQITKLHTLANGPYQGLIRQRPFRSPHHTASSVSLIGGGTKPRPGEISLSHGGVLFLDEMPEFPRNVLEVLRQPLEEGTITVARAAGVVTYPARFMLIGTRNPCPCGYGDDKSLCDCTPGAISQYQRKVSGPLLDRIDLIINVTRVDYSSLVNRPIAESSHTIKQRVERCRELQNKRTTGKEPFCNAQMNPIDIQKYCKINNETNEIALDAMQRLGLSARSFNRVLKVARTIADLANCTSIEPQHFREALQYRPQPRLAGAQIKPGGKHPRVRTKA